jgi:hypothetical protein
MTETIGKLAAALAVAQAEIKNAPFNRHNPHFKSRYADLASIRDAVTPALAKNGIALVQLTDCTGAAFVLRTRLVHSSGEYIEATYPLPMAADKPQVMGSAISYAKRYSMAAICGIASEDDDDAEGAHGRKEPAEEKTPPRPVSATKGGTKTAALPTDSGDVLIAAIVACDTAEALAAWGNDNKAAISKLPTPEQDRVRRAWGERSRILKQEAA